MAAVTGTKEIRKYLPNAKCVKRHKALSQDAIRLLINNPSD
jgi:hypothetical protein